MNKNILIHLTIITLGSLFIILSIFHTNLWFDEAYSVGMAKQNFLDIWQIGSFDVHPLLYYFILRIINLLTNGSIIMYRVFSSLGIILLGIIGITHIKKDFGEKIGIIFSFLCYFLPIMCVYGNEIRMYSWAAYISAIILIYSYRIYNKEKESKNWVIFGIASLLNIYLHYYCLLLVGVVNLILLIYFIKNKKWNNLRKQLIIILLLFLFYLPWILNMVYQVKHIAKGFWIGFDFPKTIIQLIGFYISGNMNMCIGFLINMLLILYIINSFKKRRFNKSSPDIICAIIYLFVIFILLVVSFIFKTSIIHHRYLFVLIPLYIFVLSFVLSKEKNKYIISVCSLIFILGIISNIIQIQNNYAKENNEQIQYVKEDINKDDVIVYMNNELGSIFAINFLDNKQYFYNPQDWGIKEAYKVWAPQMEIYTNLEFVSKLKGRIWVIDSIDEYCYNNIFNKSNFRKIKSKYFQTKYQDYSYNIILVEKIY